MDKHFEKPWRTNPVLPLPDDYNEVLFNGRWFKVIGKYKIMRRLQPVLGTWVYRVFIDNKHTPHMFSSLEDVCAMYPEVTMTDIEAAMWLSQKELPKE